MANKEEQLQETSILETSKKTRVGYERQIIWTVRGVAVLLGLLLVVFFIVVIRNTSTINSQVEYVKESPYPISVAAGHIETDLVHMQAVIDGMTTQKLIFDNGGTPKVDNSLDEILKDLEGQMAIIKDAARPGDLEVERMNKMLELLKSRSQTFTEMIASHSKVKNTYEDVTIYANSYLDSVINAMLAMNDSALETTSQRVESMYTRVNDSVTVLFMFTVIMSIAVIATSIFLLLVINIRGNLEKELRANLTDALEETKKANQAKSAFMANMSHDIRTPMNAIVGLTQIALESIDDPIRVKQCLTRITTSSQHLLSLINDVLDMNKIESGKVTLSEEVFSLNSLASEIETLFQSQPDSKKRDSEVVVEDVFADLLIGDAMRLRQILLNLVSNAIKYTNEGDLARLTIKENKTSKKNKVNVVFIVEDSGIGMKPEFIKRIFEPFERENNDFTIFTEGTGLGMAITKNLVDLMGGDIKVESDLGIGTKVTISIDFEIAPKDTIIDDMPENVRLSDDARYFEKINADEEKVDADYAENEALEEGSASADQQNANSDGKAKAAKKLSVKGNVLIVEDNEINMEIAKQLISSRGATVDEAFDGIEAVKIISCSKEGDYDLIFMDWQMPHMNGIEATESIRKFLDEHGREQIPIVAMTANAFESDRQTALEAGMNEFMAKPINIHQLEGVLKKYLTPA